MAFWGIEVKPWKPIVHSTEKARGRLRISQATLGIGGSKEKSIVQCNVGKRSPVLLCVLLPNSVESCHLDLEFEEADDVVFSVIGPRSVYLTGYYISKNRHSNPHSDTESYGVDIDDSPTEKSSYCSEDDKYEDSFIDDDDLKFCSPSPVSSTKVDATSSEKNDRKNRKGRGRRLQKKNQVVESDDEANPPDSEDEDGYLLSVFKSKKTATSNSTAAGEEVIPQATDIEEKPGREKARKKRKGRSEEDKAFEIQSEGTKLEIGDRYSLPPPDLGSGDCKRTKKRRKEQQLENEVVEKGDQEQKADDNVNTKSEPLDNVNQSKKIKKKKHEITEVEGDLCSGLASTIDDREKISMKIEDHPANGKPIPTRTLSNGLIIEELASGPPDGKVAAPGKKVKIYYTAMLRENGHMVDSNVGKTALKFRLGDEGIMEGWNLGLDGMHVGDKRRLVIPPSMAMGGCREHGTWENVPPNSWVVYDVELVGIRK